MSSAARLALTIDNFRHIRRAYGEQVAQAVFGDLRRLLTDLFHADAVVTFDASGTIDLIVTNSDALGGGSLAEACRTWLDEFLSAVPLLPFKTVAGVVHLWMSGHWSISDGAGRDGALAPIETGIVDLDFSGEPPDDRPEWADRYRRDMAIVAEMLPVILPERASAGQMGCLSLAWQAVCDACDPAATVYHETLLRLVDPQGNTQSPSLLFPALERLGFVRPVDHRVVSQVIEELATSPDIVLSVNISAHSVRCDRWWTDIQSRLKSAPDVARRLVLEITETAAIPNMSQAVRFIGAMRRLGCRIALDDFGTGHSSIRQLMAFAPDFVKIDRFFVRRIATSEADRALLIHLISLARCLGATVVVEGIETPEQARIVLEAGARWQQGYHWGRPALLRPWRSGGLARGWPPEAPPVHQMQPLQCSTGGA